MRINKFNIIFVNINSIRVVATGDNTTPPLEECIAMVKIKNGFFIRTQNNYAETKKIYNYNIAVSPFEFKDSYDNFPEIDYDKYPIDYLVIDTKVWALMLRDLQRSVYSMAMQIAYILEPNTNIVKITKEVSSALYSRSGKPARYWTTVVNILQDYGFMVRTNQKSTYVINHNIIFKGNLKGFAEKYKEIYGDYKGCYNEAGNFIIDKRNRLRQQFNSEEMAKKIEEINYRVNKYKHQEGKFEFNPIQDNEQ